MVPQRALRQGGLRGSIFGTCIHLYEGNSFPSEVPKQSFFQRRHKLSDLALAVVRGNADKQIHISHADQLPEKIIGEKAFFTHRDSCSFPCRTCAGPSNSPTPVPPFQILLRRNQ